MKNASFQLLSPVILVFLLLHNAQAGDDANSKGVTRVRGMIDTVVTRIMPDSTVYTQTFRKGFKGNVVSITADSVTVKDTLAESGYQTYALDEILKLQVLSGQQSRIGYGVLFGAGVGVGLAVLKNVLSNENNRGGDNSPGTAEISLLGGIGMMIGGVIGSAIKVDNWKDVNPGKLHSQVQLGFVPDKGLVMLSLRF